MIVKEEHEKMTRHEVEYFVSQMIEAFAWYHNLPSDFYGDCYPQVVLELENHGEQMTLKEFMRALCVLEDQLRAMYL